MNPHATLAEARTVPRASLETEVKSLAGVVKYRDTERAGEWVGCRWRVNVYKTDRRCWTMKIEESSSFLMRDIPDMADIAQVREKGMNRMIKAQSKS